MMSSRLPASAFARVPIQLALAAALLHGSSAAAQVSVPTTPDFTAEAPSDRDFSGRIVAQPVQLKNQ